MTASAGFNPILVTGAAGFLGACAVRELLQRGHEVHALLRPQSNLWRLHANGLLASCTFITATSRMLPLCKRL